MTTIINGSSPSITFSDSTTQTTAGLTGSASQLCKAWVNFAAAAGGATVNSSFNVSSVTRTGTGQYQVTMTTAMPNIYYVALGTTGVAANGYDANRLINIDVWSTSIINITLTSASSGSPGDFSYVGVAVLSS